MTITVTSTAFEPNKPIPKKYTGDGEDASPPLAWTKVPEGTKELALICDDPDAPVGTWTHWVLYKIPADTTSLPEGLPREKTLNKPAGAVQGVNSWHSDNLGYRGPAPPAGKLHHYHFKLYVRWMRQSHCRPARTRRSCWSQSRTSTCWARAS